MSAAPASVKARPSALRPLTHPPFALLIFGQGVSQIGDAAIRIALIIFVVQLTGSATALGIVTASFMLPNIVTFFFSGMVVDRLRRRTVMIASDMIRTVLTVALALLATVRPPLAAIAVIYALFGVSDAFFQPAYRAYLPQILGQDELYAANAMDTSARRAGLILGPVLGVLLVHNWGPASAFWADAASFAVSVLTLLFIGATAKRPAGKADAEPDKSSAPSIAPADDAATPAPEPAGLAREATEGIRYLWAIPWLGLMILSVAVVNAGVAGSMDVTLPFFVRQQYGQHSAMLGIIYAVQAAGALVGAIASGQYSPRLRRPGIAAQVTIMGMVLPVLVLALRPDISIVLLFSFVFGFSVDAAGVIYTSLMQQHVPQNVMGRVFAADYLIGYSLMPFSVFITGIILPHTGTTMTFAVTGAIMMFAAAAPLASSRLRRLIDEGSDTQRLNRNHLANQ